ncbi:LacI family DNA-binding transcriptional regulator [Renibacterium salmoninarum]|uniref:LacI family DNA-binding transcriptional regulator n=1 Tax=Renibacterium salmoninarum TaxID=1646 RepID=UPI00059F1521|nr:LacI family DNA-binding transcriptional regulator [Renibacterium salmoninarum]
MNRKTSPTIKSVATLAGVSPMTASRVISGSATVSPAAAQKVLAAAEQLGYRRNEQARALRPGQSSGLIGIAITNIANAYYADFVLGAESVANEHGRRILLGSSRGEPEREKQLLADFEGRQVEGLILVPTDQAPSPGPLSAPRVLASRTRAGGNESAVLVDDVGGARQVVTGLIDAGCRSVGFVGSTSMFTGRRRHSGYLQALAERGLVARAEHQLLDGNAAQPIEETIAALQALMASPEPPQALFCANNVFTSAALLAIHRNAEQKNAGRAPRMLGGFDALALAELSPVPLLLAEHDGRELGRRSAVKLFEALAPTKPEASEQPSPEAGADEVPVSLKWFGKP